MLKRKAGATIVPWKIHPENTKPVGVPPGAHIVPELPPLFTFETRDEAEAKLRELVERGITNVYIVGYDA
jgi:hypothetical protein